MLKIVIIPVKKKAVIPVISQVSIIIVLKRDKNG